jgi:PAS domain S-box-containing protein
MKEKVLSATLAIVYSAWAQSIAANVVVGLAISDWLSVISGFIIGASLLGLAIILWWVYSVKKWKLSKTALIAGVAFLVLTGLTYVVDAFNPFYRENLISTSLQVIAAVTLLYVIGALLANRKHLLRLNNDAQFENLVAERTKELNALNQQLQMEIESRKVAEKEVAKREKRFRALIENITDGIVLNDENTTVLYQSPSVTRILGYTFEERQRKPVLNYVHPDDKTSFLQFYEELASQPGQPLPFQFRFKHKNGDYIWLEGVVTNLLHDRNVGGYVANYRDISSRKAAEESLRHERYLLRTLIDNVPDYIYVKDTELRHIINNKANVELIGALSEAETIGKTVVDYFGSEVANVFMEEDRKVLASGQPILNVEEKIVGRNNEVRWLLTSKIPLIEKEQAVGLIGISRDITERKKAELLLHDLNASLSDQASRLAASNAELERFAYVASHDLQEPLRMVRSFLQLLKKKSESQLDADSHRYIDLAVEAAERMKHLISDLLEYSRIGVVQERLERVDMNVVVQRALEVLRESIISSGAHMDIQPLPTVNGIKIQLGQVIQNLVSNALKYSGTSAPQIKIEGSEEATFWRFSVSDKGIGIDPRFHDKIFVIFQRLDNQSETKGSGIGLAICKRIVESHGGKIWVESSPEEGSTFHFTISKTK